jgi:hypothetical protein
MGKPYKTQERRHIGHKPLKAEKLDKIYVGVLSGSESRKWVYGETI